MEVKNRRFGKHGERGAVTIEATIALTTFLFVFITIYSLITVCRAQARVQVAINSTAKEISQYSYLYGLTGLDASLAKFQGDALDAKEQTNAFVDDVVNVFDGIQSIGGQAASIDISDTDALMTQWENIGNTVKATESDFSSVKQSLEKMAENPQELLFGMTKLIGSEGLEIAKSRAIAEPISRALVKKHLKRSENDSAEACCASLNIIPDTYFGKKSYFNGIDFSNSTLFPYGSDEITIVASYKIKLPILLPIDVEYSITQSAKTKAWLHGDGGVVKDSTTRIEQIKKVADGSTIWNNCSVNERSQLIVSDKVAALKKDKHYYAVSGETHIKAYDQSTNTVVLIGSSNPLYGIQSISEIDDAALREDIRRKAGQIKSATDNKTYITIKKFDSKGNIVTDQIDCTKTELKATMILVVPEDEGLKAHIEKIIEEEGYTGWFEVEAGYGSNLKEANPAENGGAGE